MKEFAAIFYFENRNLASSPGIDSCPVSGVGTAIVSAPSSNGTSFLLILLALGGAVWLVQQAFTPPSKPAPAPTAEEAASSTYSRSVDYSRSNSEAMSNSMNDQLKSVQQMTGGSYDGQTYVLPQGKK